jgi:hypothetical protein
MAVNILDDRFGVRTWWKGLPRRGHVLLIHSIEGFDAFSLLKANFLFASCPRIFLLKCLLKKKTVLPSAPDVVLDT